MERTLRLVLCLLVGSSDPIAIRCASSEHEVHMRVPASSVSVGSLGNGSDSHCDEALVGPKRGRLGFGPVALPVALAVASGLFGACAARPGNGGNPDATGGGDSSVTPDGQGGGGVDAECPAVTVNLGPTTPHIYFLLDQSGSMTATFGNATRWQAVRDALTGPNNQVAGLEGKAYVSATLYSAQGATCPGLIATTQKLNGGVSDINALLSNNNPLSGTPTGESVAALTARIRAENLPASEPAYILLATDGEPDTCADPTETPAAKQLTIDNVAAAHALGIRTIVLSVGTQIAQTHLQHIANAGQGLPIETANPAPYYVASNPAQLAAGFSAMLRGTRTCEFTLSKAVDPSAASTGVVTMNGAALAYGTAWTVDNSMTLRLVGEACETLKNADNVVLAAQFPCGAIIE